MQTYSEEKLLTPITIPTDPVNPKVLLLQQNCLEDKLYPVPPKKKPKHPLHLCNKHQSLLPHQYRHPPKSLISLIFHVLLGIFLPQHIKSIISPID